MFSSREGHESTDGGGGRKSNRGGGGGSTDVINLMSSSSEDSTIDCIHQNDCNHAAAGKICFAFLPWIIGCSHAFVLTTRRRLSFSVFYCSENSIKCFQQKRSWAQRCVIHSMSYTVIAILRVLAGTVHFIHSL